MQRRSIVFGFVFVLGLAVIAWQEYYPSSGMFEAMGMTGPTARSGRQCGHWWRHSIFGYRIPLRAMVCKGPHTYSPGERHEEEVSMDGLTRRVTSAQRFWSVDDSVGWVRQGDSIGRVFAQRGAHRVACPRQTPYPLSHIVGTEYWKFQSFYLRLTAYDWARSPLWTAGSSPFPRWDLQLDGYPGLPEWCTGVR